MDFSQALDHLKAGGRVCRAGWNGRGMWLSLVTLWTPGQEKEDVEHHTGNPQTECLPFIGMKTADNKFVPWLCSQTDMLAHDWGVVYKLGAKGPAHAER